MNHCRLQVTPRTSFHGRASGFYSNSDMPHRRAYRCNSSGDYYLSNRKLSMLATQSASPENSVRSFWLYMILLPLLQVAICMVGAWVHDNVAANRSFQGQCPGVEPDHEH